ncbi:MULTISPECIES: lipopolysaccharide biosynthesis protein [Myroides]|uniref:Oligosaccharide flippase family protein n=1 Tax=Myroides albus TaxID=2562892 RepID=A0A6I3LHK0_9FLAO|nr:MULTISPECIES: oligosaccharide flippase family protein [Myroides]MTG97274.1 oligosaccharide flippase family protein [Myroides albus]MVX37340.1 oligosaccharide flippase family protein [Myroides sp. LoEW2-1]UVD80639.1 oligosaccharide flippase family protein [Myroides albus]
MKANISTKQALLFTVINYIGVVIGVVSTILIYPQDKEMLGVIRFVDACAQIMYPIIVLGSTHALINYYPKLNERLQSKLFSFSLLSLFKLALCLGIVLFIGMFFYQGEDMKFILYAYPLAFSMAYIELFRRQATNLQKISFPTFFEKIIPKITLPTVFLLVIYLQYSISKALVLYILSYFLIALVIGWYIYRYFKFKWHWSYSDLFTDISKREYYQYSLFAFAGSFGSFFAFRVDSLMIPYFISYEANGTYNIGVALASTLAIPATGVFALYAPVISELLNKGDLRTLNYKYKEVARSMFFIGMFLFSCTVVGIADLFQLMPTYDKLAPSLPIIYLLGINVVINMSTGFNTEIISYSKYYRFNLVSILCLMVLNVLLNIYFLTQTTYGILGVGIASMLSLTLFNVGKTYYIYKKMRLWPFDSMFMKLFFVMIGICLLVFYLPSVGSHIGDLLVKVFLVLCLNLYVLFKTQWAEGLRSQVVKILVRIFNLKM